MITVVIVGSKVKEGGKMENLQWPLAVLSRAIKYKNLTGASQHIGLSQPQLSRLVSQLESDLHLNLLDRSSKRNATWTPVAYKLSEIYSLSAVKLKNAIMELQTDDEASHIHLATLEGLYELALKFSQNVFRSTKVSFIQLDVLDLHEMESLFLSGEVDLLFTSRAPGKKKYKYQRSIGHQTWEVKSDNSNYQVFSPFEYDQTKIRSSNSKTKTLVSNSLVVRREWLAQHGGSGKLPGPVSRKIDGLHTPVMIVGADHLKDTIWKFVSKF